MKRNLSDAEVAGLSADGRYGFAYNAARTLATMVIRASGYRITSKIGGHYYTFLALEVADAAFAVHAVMFDVARGKRNEFSYDDAGVVTDTEADDLLGEVRQFRKDVERWIAARDATLA